MFTKGADSKMDELKASKFNGPDQKHFMDNLQKSTDHFARQGLRTLWCARTVVDAKFYSDFQARWKDAETSTLNRKQKLNALADEIEKNLDINGALAVEDRLQDFVPETIDILKKANINIWVLTGDKKETAIEISRSSKLFKSLAEMDLHEISPLPDADNCGSPGSNNAKPMRTMRSDKSRIGEEPDSPRGCFDKIAGLCTGDNKPRASKSTDVALDSDYLAAIEEDRKSYADMIAAYDAAIDADKHKATGGKDHGLVLEGSAMTRIFEIDGVLRKEKRQSELLMNALTALALKSNAVCC